MDRCINLLGKARVFLTLRVSSTYWQVKVAKESRDETALISHHGQLSFICRLFLLIKAPGTFSVVMDVTLVAVKWPVALVYLGDMIISSISLPEDIEQICQVLCVL